MDGETVHTGRITRRTLLVASAAQLAGADLAQGRRLTPKQARALRAAVRGGVYTPATSGYDGTLMGFGTMEHAALKGHYLVLREWRDGKSLQVERRSRGE